MFDKLKEMMGFSPALDYNELLKEGGVIVDVRTKGEYSGGHIKGSKNIPLQSLNSSAALPKDKNKQLLPVVRRECEVLQPRAYLNLRVILMFIMAEAGLVLTIKLDK